MEKKWITEIAENKVNDVNCEIGLSCSNKT